MIKRLAVIGIFTFAIAAPAHAADVHIGVAIGAPVARVPVAPVVVAPPPAPYPGYVWQPEHYIYTAYGYRLVPGQWVPAAPYVGPDAYVGAPVVVAPRPAFGFGIRIGDRGRDRDRDWDRDRDRDRHRRHDRW